jgi:hypothetical protein
MADVRSMLRAQRAARAPPKSRHPQTAQPNKKRKADDDDGEAPGDTRKRTKAEETHDLPAGFFDGGVAEPSAENLAEEGEEEEEEEEADNVREPPLAGFVAAKEPDPQIAAQRSEAPPPASQTDGKVPTNFFDNTHGAPDLDDEWAAFEREVAVVPAPPRPTALEALQSGAVISAAPLSAAELASQAKEDRTTQRVNREEELAAEKEDAARTLEDEFEEMEALEERVKRLREKREKLRESRQTGDQVEDVVSPIAPPLDEAHKEDSEEDDDDGDEWDGWKFGTS